jgi:AcrR family transcriptional regulator
VLPVTNYLTDGKYYGKLATITSCDLQLNPRKECDVEHNGPMTDRAPRRPGRPSGGKHLVDRERMLDAAERAIRRDGSGVSIDAIANEAGVTKPIVYARVGKRTDLADALAQRLADRLMHAGAAAISKGPTRRTRLVAMIHSNLETLAEHRELFLFVTSGASEEMPQRRLFLAGQSAKPLADQITAWRTAQGLDPSVAEAWSYAVVGLLNMVSLWWINESAEPAERVAEHLTELLWSGLEGSSAKGSSAKGSSTKGSSTKGSSTKGSTATTKGSSTKGSTATTKGSTATTKGSTANGTAKGLAAKGSTAR